MNRPPVVSPVSRATPFAWRDVGFGAVAAFGFVLLAGGHRGRHPLRPQDQRASAHDLVGTVVS